MVESKFVVLQMIPYTLFIEWDFEHYSHHCSLVVYCSRHCSLAVLLFTSRWYCSLAVVKLLFVYTVLFIYTELLTYYGNVHIYDTIHTTSFFLQMFIFRFI